MPYRTVNSGLIVDKTIVTADLADDAVTAAKIAACVIEDANIKRGTITGAALTNPLVLKQDIKMACDTLCAHSIDAVCMVSAHAVHASQVFATCLGGLTCCCGLHIHSRGIATDCLVAAHCGCGCGLGILAKDISSRCVKAKCSMALPHRKCLECGGSIIIASGDLCFYSCGCWRKVCTV